MTLLWMAAGFFLAHFTTVCSETLKETLAKENKSFTDVLVILGCSLHIYFVMMLWLSVLVVATALLQG